MRDSWLEKYHQQQHSKEETNDSFDAFIELSESPDFNIDEDEAWAKLSSGLELHQESTAFIPKRFGLSSVYKIAAVITLAIISFFIYESETENQNQLVTFSTSDKSWNHKLPDGSSVYLDSYSTITYPEDFSDRTLEFTGSGYYDVKAGSPFTVKMGELKVKVLGTVFTLESNDTQLRTYVKEGKVQVSGGSEVFSINPGELLTFIKEENKFTLTKNTDQNILSWKTGKFIFKSTTLPEVIKNLERYYKVEFQNQKNLSNCTVTAEFDQQELSEVLAILGEVLDLKFTNTGSIVKILGKGCH